MIKELALIAALAALLTVFSTAGPLFHLEEVEVRGDWARVTVADVHSALSRSGKMSLIFGNFDVIATELATLPDVRKVSVEKDYPDRLVVNIQAREPVARAAQGGLVDSTGQWYPGQSSANLPIFEVTNALLPQAVALHTDVREHIETLGMGINQLHHADDGWRLFLNNGWVLLIGEGKLRERLDRFVKTWPQLQKMLDEGASIRVDLRYPHGMAVTGLNAEETT